MEDSGESRGLWEFGELNREERHLAALLFALLLDDPEGMGRLLGDIGLPELGAQPCPARVYFELACLRDRWVMLRDNHERLGLLATQLRGLSHPQLPAFGASDERFLASATADGSVEVLGFNRLFSTRPSRNLIESPARWSASTIEGSLDEIPIGVAVRALLLSWSYRIKPDIVLALNDGSAVALEAKYMSTEDAYIGQVGDTHIRFSQTELQKLMLEQLAGVTRAYSRRVVSDSKHSLPEDIGWTSAFRCFEGSRSERFHEALPLDIRTALEVATATESGGTRD